MLIFLLDKARRHYLNDVERAVAISEKAKKSYLRGGVNLCESDKERFNKLYNGSEFTTDDINFLLEKAQMYFLLETEDDVENLRGDNEALSWDNHKLERRLEGMIDMLEECEKGERKKIKSLNQTITRLSQEKKQLEEENGELENKVVELEDSVESLLEDLEDDRLNC